MKKAFFSISIVFVLIILCFAACSSGTTTVTPSSDPTIYSMTLRNDSFPALRQAVFTVDDRIDRGHIYNLDSIAYGTEINAVVPQFVFNGSAVAAAVIYTPNDTVTLLSGDTVDFSEKPALIHVVAQDLSDDKWYEIDVNVHQVDPDLFVWNAIADNIYSTDFSIQKALLLNNMLCLFLDNGFEKQLMTSTDGVQWQQKQTPQGLPENANIKNIISDGQKLVYAAGKDVYESVDGENWQLKASVADFDFVSMLFSFNDELWAIAQVGADTLQIAKSADGADWELQDAKYVDDFPVSDFATVVFQTYSGRPRAMVMGGYNQQGKMLNSKWNVEYDDVRGYRWINFSEATEAEPIAGASIVYYNDQLLLFGAVLNDDASHMYFSTDEGVHWNVADTVHNKMPDTYMQRTNQSVVVDADNYIYIIGGQTANTVLTDVYKGKLNSVDW